MRVNIRLLRQKGRYLNRSNISTLPPYTGTLKVSEMRDQEMARTLVQARLLDTTHINEVDVLPELLDAQLLYADGKTLRMSGIERIDGTHYAQTWSIECLSAE
ncbi:hypothetical protein [Aquabacterium sp.]|uniref:hypothetical protein n=1 Tax=Aquabacterium sp. TaxID=1872578 RepID=UPI003BB1256A